MKHWDAVKAKYPEPILLFRIGEYYQSYYGDAVKLANTIGVTLTHKDQIALAGFPVSSFDTNLQKIIKSGYKVAVCETQF